MLGRIGQCARQNSVGLPSVAGRVEQTERQREPALADGHQKEEVKWLAAAPNFAGVREQTEPGVRAAQARRKHEVRHEKSLSLSATLFPIQFFPGADMPVEERIQSQRQNI